MQVPVIRGLDPRKRIASVFLTPRCDMACRFCASEDGFSEMSYEEASGLLQALKGRVDSVVLGGGEPFLWPHDLQKLAEFASEQGFIVQVCTNGVNLPSGFESVPGIHRYILPLESLDPDLHGRLRVLKGGGHYGLVLDRMRVLAMAGREFTLSTVVTRHNVGGLMDLAGWLREACRSGLKVHAWHLYRFLPVGRGGGANAGALAVDRDEYLLACRAVKAMNLPFAVYQRNDMQRSSTVEFFWFDQGRLCMGSETVQ